MSCPICNHTELEEGAESCPKCGSDLEIFTHIENAHKENTFQKKSILVLTALFGIVLVSWGSASFFSGSKTASTEVVAVADTSNVVVPAPAADPNALTASSTPVEAFVNANAEAKPEVDPLNTEADVKAPATPETKAPVVSTPAAKTPAVKAPVSKAVVVKEKKKVKVSEAPTIEDGIIIHKVKRGDSFWKISKKYFGNGNHAKQIAADNNLNAKKDIPLGTKLKIKK
jgi:nucleoid-associated protein YgaU